MTMIFTCAWGFSQAQVNFVKNPSFEEYTKCPDDINQLIDAKYWSCAVDTIGSPWYTPEYYNTCAVLLNVSVPDNTSGYQYPRTGNAYIGAHIYYDKSLPLPIGVPPNFRDYAQGHLISPLLSGKTYCVSFWVALGEVSGYAQNKIGAYLDDGGINDRDTPGTEIIDLLPQVFSTSKIKDTLNWTKIEGSFVAAGNETHITLGNFAKNTDVDTEVMIWGPATQYSYYLFDDISVIPLDLSVDAGKDAWVPVGNTVQIGRVGDITALGLDCKWYYKGALIDSGAIISVNAATTKGIVDTYVVVQTICGLVKKDTVLVKTVGVGFNEFEVENTFKIYPNPGNGHITIQSNKQYQTPITIRVLDLLGRAILIQKLTFLNNQSSLQINTSPGIFLLELTDPDGSISRQRMEIIK